MPVVVAGLGSGDEREVFKFILLFLGVLVFAFIREVIISILFDLGLLQNLVHVLDRQPPFISVGLLGFLEARLWLRLFLNVGQPRRELLPLSPLVPLWLGVSSRSLLLLHHRRRERVSLQLHFVITLVAVVAVLGGRVSRLDHTAFTAFALLSHVSVWIESLLNQRQHFLVHVVDLLVLFFLLLVVLLVGAVVKVEHV